MKKRGEKRVTGKKGKRKWAKNGGRGPMVHRILIEMKKDGEKERDRERE